MPKPQARRYRNITGPQIRRLRLVRGLSQEQLAAKLQLAGLGHVDRVTVAKIESQIRSVFDWELMVIGEVLGAELAEFGVPKRSLRSELPSLIRGWKG